MPGREDAMHHSSWWRRSSHFHWGAHYSHHSGCQSIHKNEQKPASLHARTFWPPTRSFIDKLDVRHKQYGGNIFPTFALFCQTSSQQTRIITLKIMLLFATAMRPHDYYATEKSNLWKVKTEIRENRRFLKADRHLNPILKASRSKRVLSGIAMSDLPQKKHSKKTR